MVSLLPFGERSEGVVMGSELAACRVCEKLYSISYKTCPHCKPMTTSGGAEANSWLGCLSLVVVALVFLAGYRSCSQQNAKQDVEREQAARALDDSDRKEAIRLGISIDDYRSARWASNKAYAECKTAAERRAKHDYKSDWVPNWRWDLKGRTILGVGHDLQMQNGFGVYSYVSYFCDWDMDSRSVKSLTVTED